MIDRRDDETEMMPAAAAHESGWRLVDVRTGHSHEIPPQGMVIGRDEQCDIVLAARGVSRRHAVIRRAGAGYTITDESKNGTFVNDARVQHLQTLARGDVVRIATESFRVESSARSESPSAGATEVLSSFAVPPRVDGFVAPRAAPPPPPPPIPAQAQAPAPLRARTAHRETPTPALATLEVTRGRLSGTSFTVSRPVCSIGRDEINDIVIDEESVSASHATLLLKANVWYVLDLRSSNGTFVDGYRVAGERVLADGASLTLGDVRMVFRQRFRFDDRGRLTNRRLSFLARLARLIGAG